jgi:hypothetical protein
MGTLLSEKPRGSSLMAVKMGSELYRMHTQSVRVLDRPAGQKGLAPDTFEFCSLRLWCVQTLSKLDSEKNDSRRGENVPGHQIPRHLTRHPSTWVRLRKDIFWL